MTAAAVTAAARAGSAVTAAVVIVAAWFGAAVTAAEVTAAAAADLWAGVEAASTAA